ncbi:MAG: glutaminyl-peptide cyclotransferase [Arachidicoccus sp.]|nr:glutaminyl-peptide cyclotransferase [Arachidicoccus sp.]
MKFIIVSLFFALAASCGNSGNSNSQTPTDVANTPDIPFINYSVINTYPHDSSSFTEGLFLLDGKMFESSGSPGNSDVSKLFSYDLKTGKPYQTVPLPKFFGEGISVVDNKLYQLTYKEHKVFVYDYPSLKKTGEFSWPYEGWGMTTDGKNLIISTGSSNLYYVNPSDFKIIKTINVSNNYGPLSNINELEYVNGIIYANVWQTDFIVKINPDSAKVTGQLDLSNIRQKNGVAATGDVLNGIAYDSTANTLLVTGKDWSKIFELKLN